MEPATSFEIGDRVFHIEHGLGTVEWTGPDYVGVTFDLHGKALLKRNTADMRLATASDELQPSLDPECEATNASTVPSGPFFVREAGGATHSMGSHWEPFFDDVKTVLLRLPEVIKVADVHGGYSQFFPAPERADEDWPQGALLLASSEAIADVMGFVSKPHRWDDQTSWRSPGGALEETPERAQAASARESGVAALLQLATAADESNMLRSLFPYSFHGVEQTIVLECVHVWENGLEAQIEGALGDVGITFYDVDFVNNRDWYRRGQSCQFVLAGIAYRACVATVQEFTVQRTPEWFDGIKWLSGKDEMTEGGTLDEKYSTEGMSMLLPVSGWDVDEYSFRGPVKDVWGMSMLGLRAWRVRITVIRPSGDDSQDVDLDIIVTGRAWTGDAPPQVGQELEGEMWLQGRLWSTHAESEVEPS